MLLKCLYDYAHSRNLLDAAFARKAIRWVIQLDRDGNLLGAGPMDTSEDGKRGQEFFAPETGGAKNDGRTAEFLWGDIRALFGLAPDVDNPLNEREQVNLRRKHENFWQRVQQAFDASQFYSFKALLNFHEATGTIPSFLRWGVSNQPKANENPDWWIRTAKGTEVRLGADNFSFAVEGTFLLNDDEIIRPLWRRLYASEVEQKEAKSDTGTCLITGEPDVPIAATHLPKIEIGYKDTPPGGAAIVSCEKSSPAFSSYGFKQSYNAPTSIEAATAYCVALNHLLKSESHKLRIGATTVCFWARNSEEATDALVWAFEQPKPESVREFLRAPQRGTALPLDQPDEFYSVTLLGNSGRVVVRHWMQMTVAQAVDNFRLWFTDLDIIAYANFNEDRVPLAIKNLARATLREAKGKKLKDDDLLAETVSQLYRAALERHTPSLMLVHSLIERFKTDLTKNGLSALNNLSRFALLRLVLNRHEKEKNRMIDPIISNTNDPAYNCGRLLAVFDDLQRLALSTDGKKFEGAGVVDRYYGAASSAPNSAFGVLWRLHHNHLKKLSQQGEKGRAGAQAIRKKIEEIANRFKSPADSQEAPQFPRFFDLQAQGRFALGFYQQKAFDRAARQSYLSAQADQTQPANPEGDNANA